MAKSIIVLAYLLFLCINVGVVAFQVSSPLRSTTTTPASLSSRGALIHRQQQQHASLSNKILFRETTPSLKRTLHHQNMMNHDDEIMESLPVEIIEPKEVDRKNKNGENAITVAFGTALKRVLSKERYSAFFLSIFIFLLPLFTLSAFPNPASAVMSGGRMGGTFGCGGGSSRSCGSSSSRSYSAPSSSSGYSRGYNRGYSSGYYSRPNVIVSPSVGISPFYSPFYSPYYARPSGVVVSSGPSFASLFFFAGFFLFAAAFLNGILSDNDGFGSTTTNILNTNQSVLGPGVSVAEISVALDVPDRDSPNSILSALNRLSKTARTDSRVGLQNLTSQVAIELLRRKLSIVAASTKARHYRDENKAQREYNNITIQERGKFQRETVSKYGGVDYSDARIRSAETTDYSAKATVAVVTIVMMIDGDSTSKQLSSKVNSIGDVEEALSRIAADAKADNCLRGAEILWTPEERDETLTMREVYADYSSLRSV